MRPLAFAAAFCLIAWGLAAPATRPADTSRGAELRQWLAELADRDPDARHAARVKLMGMKRQELGAFHDLVEQSRPLRPAQVASLREIVTQVYLAGEDYTRTDAPFIGIKMGAVVLDDDGPPGRAAADDDLDFGPRQRIGVVIADRVPGFCGYRMFLDGDVVLGIADPAETSVRTPEDITRVVSGYRVGQTVTFLVLRHGRALRVPVTLDAKPLSWVQIEEFQTMRRDKADEYWDRAFAALIGPDMS